MGNKRIILKEKKKLWTEDYWVEWEVAWAVSTFSFGSSVPSAERN